MHNVGLMHEAESDQNIVNNFEKVVLIKVDFVFKEQVKIGLNKLHDYADLRDVNLVYCWYSTILR